MKIYVKKLATLLLAGTLIFSYTFQPSIVSAEEMAGSKQNINLTSNGFDNKASEGLEGAGTVESPYLVDSAEDLSFVANKVNAGDSTYAKAVYKQTANIDLKGSADNQWTPIGATGKNFSGTFIGTGFEITGLYIDDAELSGAGLFGVISSPAKLEGVTVNGATVNAKAQVGAIAGSAFTGSVKNCKVVGKINISGNYKVGGMFGEGYASITDSSVNAAPGSTVTGIHVANNLEGDNVGGLIGFRGEGNIPTKNCSVSNLTVAGTRKVGGLIGSVFTNNIVEGCSVKDVEIVCNATKAYGIENSSAMGFGGILGLYTVNGSSNGTLKNCSVENAKLKIENKDLEDTNIVTMGYVSGGQRSFKAPAETIDVENITVLGNNSGSNAETKFPGSVAMNGEQKLFANGTGTKEDPFVISSADELKVFANSVNNTGLTYKGQYVNIKAGTVLDFSGEEWTPIGTSSHRFMGTFDGNGIAVKGLTNSFFGGIEDATIKNLKLANVNIKDASQQGALLKGNYKLDINRCIGTITIDGIEVTGSITGSGDYIGSIMGGRANMEDGDVITVKNCVNRATITSGAKAKIGGIIGYTNSSKGKWVIENCKNYGDVTSGFWAGGITAGTTRVAVISCVNEGKIKGGEVTGGIIGTANGGTTVTGCINKGEVVDTVKHAGGIIGNSSHGGNPVSQSANTGNITGVVAAGGIIGGTESQGDPIDNCYNSGTIKATGEKAIAGGIYGYNNSTSPIKACLNDAKVEAPNGTAYQIGLSNYWYDPAPGSQLDNCYYMDGDKIFSSAKDGKGEAVEQKDMNRTDLANKLNEVGKADKFWQPQNGSVQPDPLIPGVLEDEKRIVLIKDKDGNLIEGYTSLEEAALAVKDGQTIVLEKDVTLDKTLVIKGDKKVTLDLNGKTLSIKEGVNKPVLEVGDKATGLDKTDLTLTDSSTTLKGTLRSASNSAAICVRAGASMTTKDVKISFEDKNHDAANTAIQVQGELTVEKGTKIDSTEYGITVIGDKASLIVNDGKLTAANSVVSGNGSFSGTEIVINGGELTSTESAGIYHPQAGNLTLNGGTIKGLTGVQMCAGNLIVPKDSKVKVIGTGDDKRADKKDGDGPIDDGAAISIVDRGYPGGTPNVEIKGGSFVSEKTDNAVLTYKWDSKAEGDKHSEWPEAGEHVAISGGLYNTPLDTTLLADGFALNEPDKDGNYGVHKHVMTQVDKKDPTCTEDGVKQTYYKCDVCEKYFEDELGTKEIEDIKTLKLPATGHNFENGKCTVCGAVQPGSGAGNGGTSDGNTSGNGSLGNGSTDSNSSDSVATGDTNNVLGYGSVMLLAGLAALALYIKRRVNK